MKTVQLMVWCQLTCQNGPSLCIWRNVTATTKSNRSLQIIQTRIRQFWEQKCEHEHPFPLCNITVTCSDSLIVFMCLSSLIFGMSGCGLSMWLFHLYNYVGCPEWCPAGAGWNKAAGLENRERSQSPGWAVASRGYSWVCMGKNHKIKQKLENDMIQSKLYVLTK